MTPYRERRERGEYARPTDDQQHDEREHDDEETQKRRTRGTTTARSYAATRRTRER